MRGLVIVAVEQHEIAFGHQIREHDLVRGRRAVQHEIGLFRAEDDGGFLLRLKRGTFVSEEVAELQHRIVEVVAEDRLAQMLHEDAADRAAAVEDAAVVAGTGPELVAFLRIVRKRAEERRLQRLGILLEPGDEIFCYELRRLLGEKDIAVDEVEHLDRNVLEALATREDHDRHVEAATAHEIDEGRRLAFEALLAPVHHHAADGGVRLHRDLGVLLPPRPHDLKAHPLDRRHDLVDPDAFEVVGAEERRREQECEALEIVHRVKRLFGDTRAPPAARGNRSAKTGDG